MWFHSRSLPKVGKSLGSVFFLVKTAELWKYGMCIHWS